ncbi:MAG TPA: PH domain-containing protein [Mycobacteriales bacterium]|nr:PH domain-containing protein [Mycobacteriales bacterium]
MSLTVRPHRVRRYARIAATAVVVASALVAVLLKRSVTGVHLEVTDQLGVFGVGVFVAAGIMLVARPRLDADERGVRVRNLLGDRTVPWDVVRAVEFRDGWPWASLDLLDDEVINLMAVQAMDGDHAVAAMAGLRDLLTRSRCHGADPAPG